MLVPKFLNLNKYLLIFLFILGCQGTQGELDVEIICGVEPVDNIRLDSSTENNIIFENDPAYNNLNLYDIEGNAVTISSWNECFHYASTGWDYYIDGSKIILSSIKLTTFGFIFLFIFSLIFVIFIRSVFVKNY